MMIQDELRQIVNQQIPYKQTEHRKKIIHQIQNEGCKCKLCQKVIYKQLQIIKKIQYNDSQSQITKGIKQEYYSNFLKEFYYLDKMIRKIRIIIPQTCIFQKSIPIYLITKKRQTLPMKIIRNKEKLNAFEILNFFLDGFIYHNNLKESQMRGARKQHHKYSEILKNHCIAIAKFSSGTCQMLTPIEITNIFKSKQKTLRNELLTLTTMVCDSNFQQIRIHINISQINPQILQRAKNQVKMINQDIKPKDFMFVPEREQRKYEEQLREQNRDYLQYLSLKMLLLYSTRTDVLFQESLFKFMKDESSYFYLTDINVYKTISATTIWGDIKPQKLEKINKSPLKKNKQRPTSSPQKLQTIKKIQNDVINPISSMNRKSQYCYLTKESKQGTENVKHSSLFKLQPIDKNKVRHK